MSEVNDIENDYDENDSIISERNDIEEGLEAQDVSSPYISRGKRYAKEIVIIGFILFAVFVFRSVAYEPFKIPSGSMIPTLRIGDFILVNKFSYGWKVPFSDLTIGKKSMNPIYLFGEEKVERGDVVVFKFPKNPSVNYIKRVIGLPGETIEVKNKEVFINGLKMKTIKLDKREFMQGMDEKFKDENLSFYRAYINNKSFVYQVNNDNYFMVENDKVTVPEGHYFVMGDNRDHSYDSRLWGFVPFESIKGKAVVVWLSINIPKNASQDIVFRSERIGELIK